MLLKKSLCLLALSAAFAAHAQQTIKIALIDPLSGPMADVGKIFENHLRFGAEKINASGLMSGVKFEVLAFDNKLSTQESQAALQAAVGAGVKAVFIGGGSATVTALVNAANRNNERNPDKQVLVFNFGGIDPDLVGKNCSFWHFMTEAQVPMRMKAYAELAKQSPDIKKVYLLNPDYSFGRQWAGYARTMLTQARPDIQIVGEDYFPTGTVKDFAPYVAKMRAAGADTVVSGNWGNDMALTIRAAGESGYKLRIITHSSANKSTMIALDAAPSVKLNMLSEWFPGADNAVVAQHESEFETKYKEAFYLARLSAATELLAQGINKAKSTEPLKIASALEGISYRSILGDVSVRKEDHQFLAPLYVYANHPVDGKAVKKGFDGTKQGFVQESLTPASALQVENTCQMKRPAGA